MTLIYPSIDLLTRRFCEYESFAWCSRQTTTAVCYFDKPAESGGSVVRGDTRSDGVHSQLRKGTWTQTSLDMCTEIFYQLRNPQLREDSALL